MRKAPQLQGEENMIKNISQVLDVYQIMHKFRVLPQRSLTQTLHYEPNIDFQMYHKAH